MSTNPSAEKKPAVQSGSICYSATPAVGVVLEWADGKRVLALPTMLLASAEWSIDATPGTPPREQVRCEWGSWSLTLVGHGLRSVPAELTRGQILGIIQVPKDKAEAARGSVVIHIDAVMKEEGGDA
mgnify:CR=1 FL=1